MRRMILPLGVVALAGLLGTRCDAAQTVLPQTSEPTGVIVGVVLDQATAKAIADAIVTVTFRNSGAAATFTPQRVMTDPGGRFAFTGLPGGALLIRATKWSRA